MANIEFSDAFLVIAIADAMSCDEAFYRSLHNSNITHNYRGA